MKLSKDVDMRRNTPTPAAGATCRLEKQKTSGAASPALAGKRKK
jgi:hypothetical protein